MKKVASAVVAAATVLGVALLGPMTASAGDHDNARGRADAGAPPAPPPPTSAHGTNFQVKNGLDNSFCMDVAGGAAEGRTLSLSQCTAAASQRWGFSWNANDTNSIVDTQGMCVDIRGRHAGDGLAIAAYKCHHADNQKFTYTPTGRIQEMRSGKCLSVPRAAAGAAVFLENCDLTKPAQTWKLAQ